jgi:hypothetical protein
MVTCPRRRAKTKIDRAAMRRGNRTAVTHVMGTEASSSARTVADATAGAITGMVPAVLSAGKIAAAEALGRRRRPVSWTGQVCER